MTYITTGRSGAFEVRESRTTPAGPRSRTLATFRELDAATIEKVIERAETPPTRGELVAAALGAGATVAPKPVEKAAKDLLRALARGEGLSPSHRRLLLDALNGESRQAAEWVGTPLAQRGEAFRDLLLMADAIPLRARPPESSFPRIDSTR